MIEIISFTAFTSHLILPPNFPGDAGAALMNNAVELETRLTLDVLEFDTDIDTEIGEMSDEDGANDSDIEILSSLELNRLITERRRNMEDRLELRKIRDSLELDDFSF